MDPREFVYNLRVNDELTFEIVRIDASNIERFREVMELEQRVADLVVAYSTNLAFSGVKNTELLRDIVDLVFNEERDTSILEDYFDSKYESFVDIYGEDEAPMAFAQMYRDYLDPIASIQRLLAPKWNLLSICPRFFLVSLLNKRDDVVITMSVSADEDYKNQTHMYIFRSIHNLMKDAVLKQRSPSKISLALHSLATYAIYEKFPNGTNQIQVWSNPLPKMAEILGGVVNLRREKGPAICEFKFDETFTADRKFMDLWKTLK